MVDIREHVLKAVIRLNTSLMDATSDTIHRKINKSIKRDVNQKLVRGHLVELEHQGVISSKLILDGNVHRKAYKSSEVHEPWRKI